MLILKNHPAFKMFLTACVMFWFLGFILLALNPRYGVFQAINIYHNAWGDLWMPYITRLGEGAYIFPFGALVWLLKDRKSFALFAMIVLVLLLPTAITIVLKVLAATPRPLTVFKNEAWIHIVPGYKNNFFRSWPSGHTTGVFSFASLMVYCLTPKYKWWSLFFFFVALLVGYSRIYLSQHFFEDIVAGSVIGTAVPYFIIAVFEQKFPTIRPAAKY